MNDDREARREMRHRLTGDIEEPVNRSSWELRRSEWSPRFEMLMRNRLIMGAFRYGRLHADKEKFDRLGSIAKRLSEYGRTGNDELLVDIANLALLEFEEGDHPRKHFASIDGGEHAEIRS